jgi:NitT/TauT family transport system permease protein
MTRTPLRRGLASVAVALVAWEVVARLFFVPAVLPPPTVVLQELVDHARSGQLAVDVLYSLRRVLVGFAAGSALGLGLGLAMGAVGLLRWLLEPPVQFFRFIPPIAWLTPVLIWFGIGENGKYVLILYTTTFMVTLNTFAGVLAVPRNRVRAAQCLGAGRAQVFLHVVVPAALPFVLTGMRIGMGNSFQTLIVAEMLAANEGLGHLILHSRVQLSTELIFVGVLTLGTVGLASDAVFQWLVRTVAWRYHQVR